MQYTEACQWLAQGEWRKAVLMALEQPMTAKQLSTPTGLTAEACSEALIDLALYDLVVCLNPEATRNRLYWLSELGRSCQTGLREDNELPPMQYDFPRIDWSLYGSVLFSHRSAVLLTLGKYRKPMQPVLIKRRARFDNPTIKMSSNNTRDVCYFFLKKAIVARRKPKGSPYWHYELTGLGWKLWELSDRARKRRGASSRFTSDR